MQPKHAFQIPLRRGVAIPAHPLALNAQRKLDERRQRALSRYYLAAGAGGLAVGVHTTQFAIRKSEHGLFRPVLELATEEMDCADAARVEPIVRIGGICGETAQALAEAGLLRELRYHAGLLSLAAMKDADEDALIEHCRRVGEVMPLIGFYLQPAVGGRVLSCRFWRRFAEIESVVAVKIAPFNRYQTLDVVRAVAESGRDDIALYTGNDDNILIDLLTPFGFQAHARKGPPSKGVPAPAPAKLSSVAGSSRVGDVLPALRIVGGLLGHWAVWTNRAVELVREAHQTTGEIPQELLQRSIAITDCNAAFFDAANGFRGCIAGIHEVLRRQGLLDGTWCLDPAETMSPGQCDEIDRVYAAYPNLNDDDFVAEHLDEWLRG
jgi:dihydrodipicolinate synthase/N-acetylneuraminate lyase